MKKLIKYHRIMFNYSLFAQLAIESASKETSEVLGIRYDNIVLIYALAVV